MLDPLCPDLPDPQDALFLDFDGTLVELAPRPEAVQLAPQLGGLLRGLQSALGGALALVSGRPLAQIDAFVEPLRLCAAGVHGVERRGIDGQVRRLDVAGVLEIASRLRGFAQRHPGLQLEIKPGAVALHYRQAPTLEAACRDQMEAALAASTDMVLLHGKSVFEIKPQGASKGEAIRSFLAEAPFSHRRPLFFGDDVTDESGFEAVQAHGGIAVKVGTGDSVARHRLPDPAAVRGWLAQANARLVAGGSGAAR